MKTAIKKVIEATQNQIKEKEVIDDIIQLGFNFIYNTPFVGFIFPSILIKDSYVVSLEKYKKFPVAWDLL